MLPTNPYESPKAEPFVVKVSKYRWSLMLLLPTGMITSSIFGAVTNMINGAVSPEYFSTVMGWARDENIWLRSVHQGAIEGLAYGFAFSFIFTMTVAITSRLKCEFGHAVRYIAWATIGVFVTWGFGGAIGFLLATSNPQKYPADIQYSAQEFGVGRFGWVGGSICGAVDGGLIIVVIASALFVIRWNRRFRCRMN